MRGVWFFFFKQKTAYEMLRSLVGSEMCIRDRCRAVPNAVPALGAGRCVDAVGDRVGGEVHDAADDDRARLECRDLGELIATDDRESRDVRPVDLGER